MNAGLMTELMTRLKRINRLIRCRVFGVLLLISILAPCADTVAVAPVFQAAQPVWLKGREKEKNVTAGFRAEFSAKPGSQVQLRAAGATLFRIFLNGNFVAHGPARGPHGWYRVDELNLTPQLQPGTNVIAIEVAGYNANSYYLLDQPSFLQAEIVCDGHVLAATGTPSFSAKEVRERVQKVQRYSFQRPFSEVWRLTPGWDSWRTNTPASFPGENCSSPPIPSLLPRRVDYPEYAVLAPVWHVSSGTLKTGLKVDQPWKDRSLTGVGPQLGGYLETELETIPSLELQTVANASSSVINRAWSPESRIQVKNGDYHILDLGRNLTGFIGVSVQCVQRTRLFVTFDEILMNGEVDFKRLGCVNIIALELDPGNYRFESFEPYTLRYLKVLALQGDCTVGGIYLRELASGGVNTAHFAASDERFNRLFAAGRDTFRQNALDIFMDCPSRERAGWLCDSFFTARVALDLCGHTRIEKNFFENYLLPPRFEYLPEGMLPMCYPADHNDGVFIPNWALWFVVELEEYLERSGDRELVDALRPRVEKLFDYFKKFRNEDGLLEKLEKWVFVEWSKANDFVQDVNYPSNMLYAKALTSAGKLYGNREWRQEAERVREVIRRQSFDGTFFIDNARRVNGKLEVTRNRTEVCQYFAFFFDVATPETHAGLWHTLVKDFGPARQKNKAHAEVHPANAFVGNMMRLELLSRMGLCQQLLDESLAYQLYMVERTGTLWENDGAYASCNHGFASHGGVHTLLRDVLGLYRVDPVNKKVTLRFTDLRLDWCEGRMPTPDGLVELRWRKDGGKLRYQLYVPAGYNTEIVNRSPMDLIAGP
jgi:alpha-L-rhamnosidase